MRAWVLALASCCACNQVFGLGETVPVDARQFDAPADAPYRCPAIGTQPRFAALLHQAITKNCIHYTTSAPSNRAAAYCIDIDAIADGAIDEVPQPTVFTPDDKLDMPRLTPEGDEMWVRRRGAGSAAIAVYQHAGDHAWTWVRDLAIASGSRDDAFTVPTNRDHGRRRFLRYAFDELLLHEYDDDGLATTAIRSYDAPALGVTFISLPNITADGLRLVFIGSALGDTTSRTYYADRASLDVPFSPASVLTTAPVAFDPFLTEDCARLYTNGLGSIFYAVQQ
jgi:hypothetical protein